jgi:ubiquinone/menaquinone biosynthesis C-methylase UbiE
MNAPRVGGSKDEDSADPLDDESALRANREAWDRMARRGEPLCRPADDASLRDPLKIVDPLGWLGRSIEGWRVLCLAAGGGKHSAMYAAAGAEVTVVDLSPQMLELDRQVARERGLQIRIIEANMQSLPMLEAAQFDLVVHPVSTCYVAQVGPVFSEVARVLRGGGLYISQHKQPVSLQAATQPHADGGFHLRHRYYRDTPVPPVEIPDPVARRLREPGTREYLHRWEELLGGICRAGFVIEDLVEPLHAKRDATATSFAGRARYIPPYVRIKARRRDLSAAPDRPSADLWLPEST